MSGSPVVGIVSNRNTSRTDTRPDGTPSHNQQQQRQPSPFLFSSRAQFLLLSMSMADTGLRAQHAEADPGM